MNEGNQPIIDSLLRRIQNSEIKERVTVFGSVARGTPNPRDLDVWIDMSDTKLNGNPPNSVSAFLGLAKAFPGYFDPFVQFQNTTIVRNANCNGWTRAKNSKSIKTQVEKEGVSFATVIQQRGIKAKTSPSPRLGSPS